MFRVKVYKLNPEDNQWDDHGTGHVQLETIEKLGGLAINVTSEEDNSTILLQTKLCLDEIYQQQQDTLIVWCDPETEDDLALSFVDKKSCLEYWNLLCKLQQKLRAAGNNTLQNESYYDSKLINFSSPERELPPPTIENLSAIDRLINSISITNRENLAITLYHEDNYIETLFGLLHTIDETNEEQLTTLYSIFRGMIMLNETNLLETLLSDENILNLMDVFQHDPNLPKSKRVNHREFLTEVSVFKQVVPITDQELLSKIHQTFRIKYLRDSVLLSELDDITTSSLNTIIYYNNIEILNILQSDHSFLTKVFEELKNKENTTERKIDLISFLQQFCELAKNLQEDSKLDFFRNLQSLGLFSIFEIYLNETNTEILLPTLDILYNSIIYLPNEIRNFFTSDIQKPNYSSFTTIINCMISNQDTGIISQLSEILKRLLDIEFGSVNPISSKFLKKFYLKFIKNIDRVAFSDYVNNSLNGKPTSLYYNLLHQIFDILAFCAPKHGSLFRSYIINSKIIESAIQYLDLHGFLTLAVIRLFRTIAGQNDDDINEYLTNNNLFEPIMELFRRNNHRNNMINSAILELFAFVDSMSNRKLIIYLVEKYKIDFEDITYVNSFQNLITKYNQYTTKETLRKRKRKSFESDGDNNVDEDDDDVTTPLNYSEERLTTPSISYEDGDSSDELDELSIGPSNFSYEDANGGKDKNNDNAKVKKVKILKFEAKFQRDGSDENNDSFNTLDVKIGNNSNNDDEHPSPLLKRRKLEETEEETTEEETTEDD